VTTPDVAHRFELELTVSASPEQVWQAIASAEGISAWMVPAEVDPRLGGAVAFHMGPDVSSRGRITAFEPARRIAYEEDWAALVGHDGADVTPLLTEFLVEATSGGTCVVRVVTSAFGRGADWENEFWEDMEVGWAPLLDNLRLYLAHFPGQAATHLSAGTKVATSPIEAIVAVRDALGVAAVGDAVTTRDIRGHLERSLDKNLLVRVDEPVPGLMSFSSFGVDGGTDVYLQGYLFSDHAPAYVARELPRWQAWLDGIAAEVGTAISTEPVLPT
jgi:uncharacterized protein YndB with AHSA1/START domain